jgi:hypothetical protein
MPPHAFTFRYRVRDWHYYHQTLIARGAISFWIDEAALTIWPNTHPYQEAGSPRINSDTAIHCGVVVKSVYHLSQRTTKALVSSLMSLMRVELPFPNYSTV